MKDQAWKFFAPYGFLVLVISMVSCTKIDDAIPKPIISITAQSSPTYGENISGQVFGIQASLYKIAAYAKMQDTWYNIPNAQNPLTIIAEDSNWVCELNNEMRGSISEIAVFLLPNSYSPPILQGEPIIPIKLYIVASAKKSIILK